MSDALGQGLSAYVPPERLRALRAVRVGIVGLGGIGSNVAMMLARTGCSRFLLVDDDVVEAGNLNRQFYFPEDLGKKKVDALVERLRGLTKDLRTIAVDRRVDEHNAAILLPRADIWVEAMDGALGKKRFATACIAAGKPCVACSGMGGFGGGEMRVRKVGRLFVVGDFKSDVAKHPPLAPRVMMCAARMADLVLTLVWTGNLNRRP